MFSGSLPFVYHDSNNEKLFRISKGIKLYSPRNSKKKSAKSIYIVEEHINRVWVVILTCEINDNKEESREELIKHICQVYKATTNETKQTRVSSSQLDKINDDIDDLEEQLDKLVREIEAPQSSGEEEVRRKVAKTK